jgi:hypothetical protein
MGPLKRSKKGNETGIFEKLLTDRNYDSNLIAELFHLLETKIKKPTPFHPQCDGLSARLNQTVIKMIKLLSTTNTPIVTSSFHHYAYIDNVNAAHYTAIAFIFMHKTQKTSNQLAPRAPRSFNSFNETSVDQARVEWNNAEEKHSSNTRNSHDVDIGVVTYLVLESPILYHIDHRSVANDLITMD